MEEKYIREQYRRMGYNVSKTARSLDLDYDTTKELLEPDVGRVVGPTEPRPNDIRTLGKVGLRRFVIAVKPVTQPEWPEEFANVIRVARENYDSGSHWMYQETRDGWNILYSQKRRYPKRDHRPWFTQEVLL